MSSIMASLKFIGKFDLLTGFQINSKLTVFNSYLKPNSGRLAVISFHSLEDRIAKSHFHEVDLNMTNDEGASLARAGSSLAKKKQNTLSSKFRMNAGSYDLDRFNEMVKRAWLPLTKKVILPTDGEVKLNPRARSAKLRVAIKTQN
jgi:16S rRNA (cytosine1402-N4)-methyltransferase